MLFTGIVSLEQLELVAPASFLLPACQRGGRQQMQVDEGSSHLWMTFHPPHQASEASPRQYARARHEMRYIGHDAIERDSLRRDMGLHPKELHYRAQRSRLWHRAIRNAQEASISIPRKPTDLLDQAGDYLSGNSVSATSSSSSALGLAAGVNQGSCGPSTAAPDRSLVGFARLLTKSFGGLSQV